MPETKKYLNQDGAKALFRAVLDRYEADVTNAKADITAINTKIGTIPEGKTVVEMISDAQTAATYDDTALTARVAANEGAISTLNGDATTAGSVTKQVNDAIAAVVAEAPESFDTLKEMSDWIADHTEDASAMNSAIQANTTAIGVASQPESAEGAGDGVVATGLHKKIEDAVAAEATRATGVEGGLNTRVTALETSVGSNSVASQITTAIGALDATVTQTAGTDGLALGLTQVDGVVTGISGSIAANTYDAYGSAAAVLGASGDTATANTVFGAKAYADDVYDAMVAMTSTEIATQVQTAISEYQASLTPTQG